MSEKEYTAKQRNSLHLACELLAKQLNDSGYDMKTVLKPEIEIEWNKEMVKRYLYKPILEVMTAKTSTEDQDTIEPDLVWKTLNRHLASKFGVSQEWPDRHSQAEEQDL